MSFGPTDEDKDDDPYHLFPRDLQMQLDLQSNEADWSPGDILVDEYELAIPPETQPGDYPVVIGFYQEATGARLPVVTSDLEHDGDTVTIGTVHDR